MVLWYIFIYNLYVVCSVSYILQILEKHKQSESVLGFPSAAAKDTPCQCFESIRGVQERHVLVEEGGACPFLEFFDPVPSLRGGSSHTLHKKKNP